ncbi:MAG: cold shock domain-containing protein [Pirellulaceae bacterium]
MPEFNRPRRDAKPGPPPINPYPEDEPRGKKRFPIQRRHLGMIKFLREEENFGFIESENFRDDVFFHFTTFDGNVIKDGKTTKVPIEMDLWVEFELDEEIFRSQNKLRTKVVRPTERPRGRKLSGRDATFNIVNHHPKARRKRPTWRDKS